jgi:hypothetical protein
MHEAIRTIALGGDPALAVATARARPYWGPVSLAGDGDRARATVSGPLPFTPYGAKEELDWHRSIAAVAKSAGLTHD